MSLVGTPTTANVADTFQGIVRQGQFNTHL